MVCSARRHCPSPVQARNACFVPRGPVITMRTLLWEVPYTVFGSDSLFNLGGSVTAVQLLPQGVYVVMNGRVFDWDNVRKNRQLVVFEALDAR